MSHHDLLWIANSIHGIADDVLRNLYLHGKYHVNCFDRITKPSRAQTKRDTKSNWIVNTGPAWLLMW